MTSSSYRFIRIMYLIWWGLRLYLFPLGYEYRFTILTYFFNYLARIEVIKNNITISLASKYIDLVIYHTCTMTVSSWRNLTSLNTSVPLWSISTWWPWQCCKSWVSIKTWDLLVFYSTRRWGIINFNLVRTWCWYIVLLCVRKISI